MQVLIRNSRKKDGSDVDTAIHYGDASSSSWSKSTGNPSPENHCLLLRDSTKTSRTRWPRKYCFLSNSDERRKDWSLTSAILFPSSCSLCAICSALPSPLSWISALGAAASPLLPLVVVSASNLLLFRLFSSSSRSEDVGSNGRPKERLLWGRFLLFLFFHTICIVPGYGDVDGDCRALGFRVSEPNYSLTKSFTSMDWDGLLRSSTSLMTSSIIYQNLELWNGKGAWALSQPLKCRCGSKMKSQLATTVPGRHGRQKNNSLEKCRINK